MSLYCTCLDKICEIRMYKKLLCVDDRMCAKSIGDVCILNFSRFFTASNAKNNISVHFKVYSFTGVGRC